MIHLIGVMICLLIVLVSKFFDSVVVNRLRLRRQGSLFPADNLIEFGMLYGTFMKTSFKRLDESLDRLENKMDNLGGDI